MGSTRDDKDKGGLGDLARTLFSWPGIAIIASAAALLFQGVHFELARPAGDGAVAVEPAFGLRVESRSWKDPFQAVLPNVPAEKAPNVAEFLRASSNELSSIAKALTVSNPIAIMAVIVSGSPYPNGVEGRIRSRLAIQAAMRAGGFSSEDSDHLRYFVHARTANATSGDPSETNHPDWIYVPFEWFETDATMPSASPYKKILLLWLREPDFKPAPFARLQALLTRLLHGGSRESLTNIQMAILGPRTSAGLEAMMKDRTFCGATAPNADEPQNAAKLLLGSHIISTTATAPDAFFLTNQPSEGLQLLRRAGVKAQIQANLPGSTFTHYGATDADLCYLLVAELAMRGVDVRADNIVLLSEYDTFYGRQLPLTFKAAVLSLENAGRIKPEGRDASTLLNTICYTYYGTNSLWTSNYATLLARFSASLDRIRSGSAPHMSNIWQYTYLAGVDGDRTVRDNPKSPKKEGARSSEDDDSIDRPEGEHQLDYMGRLALELNGKWAGLLQSGGIRDVKAVGILGGDFYDKLLMLQALRRSVPHGLFFTTDLDARLNLRSQRSWTRNVVTASGFDLRLPEREEKSSLRLTPMRDDYQTGTFVGCLGFLQPSALPADQLALYEIGRLLPHRLTLPAPPPQKADRVSARNGFSQFQQKLFSRLRRTPQWLAQAPTLAATAAGYLSFLLAITLLDTQKTGWRILRGLLGLLWLLSSVLLTTSLFENGLEPLELGDGVSSFASALMLWFTAALILYAVWRYQKADQIDATNTLAFVMALIVMIVFSGFVPWQVNPPFRGPDYIFLRLLLVAVWIGTGVAVVAACFFWRGFTVNVRNLLCRLEPGHTSGNGPTPLDLRDVASAAHDAGQRSEQHGGLHFLPMAILLMLVLSCNPWTDSWHWTPWMILLIVIKLGMLLLYPISLNRLAGKLRDCLDRELMALEDAGTPDPNVAEARKLTDRLNVGCFAPLSRQPVFAALGAALGTSGVFTVIQPFLGAR
jgi:hypothetical protein